MTFGAVFLFAMGIFASVAHGNGFNVALALARAAQERIPNCSSAKTHLGSEKYGYIEVSAPPSGSARFVVYAIPGFAMDTMGDVGTFITDEGGLLVQGVLSGH